MPRIKDLQNYTGPLNRSDIYVAVDGHSFSRGMSLSGQQIHTLCKGIDGKNIEIRNDSTHIQWRWQGDANWLNLVALSSLKGENAKELEIRTQDGYIQTRLAGGTWLNLVELDSLKGPKGDQATNPNLGFEVEALEPNAAATARITGTYPNLLVKLGIPSGHDAALPNFDFRVQAEAPDAMPTAAITGSYPNLTVALGIPRGHDAALPAFTFETEKGAPGSQPVVSVAGSYPNLHLKFGIPEGLRGELGKPLVVLPNGNYGNWNNETEGYMDSGLAASATIDIETAAINFSEALVRENLQSGEKIPALFGKIRKWLSDLGALAWKNKADYETDIENAPAFKQIFGQTLIGLGNIEPESVRDITYLAENKTFTIFYYGGKANETIELPADHFLSHAAYNNDTHTLTLTVSDNRQVAVSLLDLVNEYKAAAAGGLEVVNGNEFKITNELMAKINQSALSKTATIETDKWVEDASGNWVAVVYDTDILPTSDLFAQYADKPSRTVYLEADVYLNEPSAGQFKLWATYQPAESMTINYIII